MKVEISPLPAQLGNAKFSRSVVCTSNTCIVSSFTESPSISWVSNSPFITDGEIVVDHKYNMWQQKGLMRVEWPFAISAQQSRGAVLSCALFLFNLATRTYHAFELPEETSVALLLGPELSVAVLKESFFVLELSSVIPKATIIPAKPLQYLMPNLCSSKPREILLCSMNDIQVWRFTPSKVGTIPFFCEHWSEFLIPRCFLCFYLPKPSRIVASNMHHFTDYLFLLINHRKFGLELVKCRRPDRCDSGLQTSH